MTVGVFVAATGSGVARAYQTLSAADPADPSLWYYSSSPGATKAHRPGKADAYIFRSMNGGPWEKLAGGLPEPLPHMPYALLTDPQAPNHLFAGLSNGDIWHTRDRGETWTRLPFTLPSIERSLILLPAEG